MPSATTGNGGMLVLRAADYRRMPWKNGGGETTEVAVHPADAGLGDFDWRVSMARVAADGSFSRFEGIDRTLCLLEGEGIDLSIDGRERVRVAAESEPYAFPGDAETAGSLVDGPIVDLNVMSRRARIRHSVRVLRLDGPATVRCDAPSVLVLAHGGACRVECSGEIAELAALDCAVLGPNERHLRLDGEAGVRVFVIALQASPAG